MNLLRRETLKVILVFVIIFHLIFLLSIVNTVAGEDDDGSGGGGCCCGVCYSSILFTVLLILSPIWITISFIIALVYVGKDAKNRGVHNPVLWIFLAIILGLIGLIIYLIVRPSGTLSVCSNCVKKKLQNAVVCPHCQFYYQPANPSYQGPLPPYR